MPRGNHPLLDGAFDGEERGVSALDFPMTLSWLRSWNSPCSSMYCCVVSSHAGGAVLWKEQLTETTGSGIKYRTLSSFFYTIRGISMFGVYVGRPMSVAQWPSMLKGMYPPFLVLGTYQE